MAGNLPRQGRTKGTVGIYQGCVLKSGRGTSPGRQHGGRAPQGAEGVGRGSRVSRGGLGGEKHLYRRMKKRSRFATASNPPLSPRMRCGASSSCRLQEPTRGALSATSSGRGPGSPTRVGISASAPRDLFILSDFREAVGVQELHAVPTARHASPLPPFRGANGKWAEL